MIPLSLALETISPLHTASPFSQPIHFVKLYHDYIAVVNGKLILHESSGFEPIRKVSVVNIVLEHR